MARRMLNLELMKNEPLPTSHPPTMTLEELLEKLRAPRASAPRPVPVRIRININ